MASIARKRVAQRDIARILDAAGTDDRGRPHLPAADFVDMTFMGPIDFSGVSFGRANFRGATFQDEVRFDHADFEEPAEFACATFEGTASFADAIFRGRANFEHIESVDGAPQGRPGEVTFRRWADFRDVRFESGANFGGTLFMRRARFGGAIFGGPAAAGAVEPIASFEGARFERARTFGPMLVWGTLRLDRVAFEGPVRIEVSARDLSCLTTQFIGRTTIELRWASVDLRDAEFAQPSIVSRFAGMFPLEDRPNYPRNRVLQDEGLDRSRAADPRPLDSPTPRVTSLSRANVGNLTLSEIDLRECNFVGAHNLDGLRFEGAEFPCAPGGLATRRRVIREELNLDEDDAGQAERIARTYRALRKGREDNKDEPGAADFYYGEMEMRRRARRRKTDAPGAARTSAWEGAILNLYRAVSGYGLRSIRAIVALVLTVIGFALLLDGCSGFDPDQSFGKSLIFSAESTSSLFRTSTTPEGAELNDEGHVFQMFLRLLGPLFFGLALLALRGRVKR